MQSHKFKSYGAYTFKKRRQKSAGYLKKRRRSGFLEFSGKKCKYKCTKDVYERNPTSADNIGPVHYLKRRRKSARYWENGRRSGFLKFSLFICCCMCFNEVLKGNSTCSKNMGLIQNKL